MTALRWAATAACAVMAALVMQSIRAPLPWMIGPLLCFALANALGLRVPVPTPLRFGGQWLVGAALGLYFTFEVMRHVSSQGLWIALAVLMSLMVSALSAQVLIRVGGSDPATAFFASSVGGAAEMANQAELHGARVDRVAAAQVVRVLMVVLIVPFAYKAAGLQGEDVYTPARVSFEWSGLALLLMLAGAAGLLAKLCSVPNGWLFGPLLVSALLTASGHPPSSVPAWVVNTGQFLIGISLGARFAPEFFRESPRFMLGVAISGGLLMLGCGCIGLAVATASGMPWPTMLLATAPGGLAEMGLTAKALQLGVPVVTAFHMARLAAVVLSAGPAYRLLAKYNLRRR